MIHAQTKDKTHKILRDFEIKTDHPIADSKADLVVKTRRNGMGLSCILTFDRAVNHGFLYTECTCVNIFITGKQSVRGLTTSRMRRCYKIIYTQVPIELREVNQSYTFSHGEEPIGAQGGQVSHRSRSSHRITISYVVTRKVTVGQSEGPRSANKWSAGMWGPYSN